ncbi:MAG: GNAT family N-acetyltransferase [Epsilonproteobacteria bacterium]|nr:GNAT family N-acetyltransferase [Campylobacterota bacterium]
MLLTPFRQSIYKALMLIPKGRVTTYKEIGNYLNSNALRSIGTAISKNPYAPVVPCHRVVKSSAEVGKYSSKRGEMEKIILLMQEGVEIENKRVKNFKDYLYRFEDIPTDLILGSSNLFLVRMKEEYIESIKKILEDKEVTKFTFENIKEPLEFIRNNFNFDSNLGLSAIIKRDTKEVVGFGGIERFDEDSYEFGYVIDKRFWGEGYGFEIAQAQLTYLKICYPNSKIVATTHPDNIYSKNILSRLGLELKKRVWLPDRGERELFAL